MQLFQKEQFCFYDGAMGTMLQRHGLRQGEAPDLMCLTRPEAVEAVHQAYLDAGSQILCTNTFGANRRNLAGSGHSVQEVVTAAVDIARRAAADRARVAVDLGPIGELMAPLGSLTFADAYEMFREMAVAGEQAGADFAAVETMADLAELRAAVLAVRENTQLPVLATMTFEHTGRTYLGTTPESFALVAEGLGVSALGVNCSVGPDALTPVVQRLGKVTPLPLIVKPNAGLPDHDTGTYALSPADFAQQMTAFAGLGVRLAGGCCGTDPDYIRALCAAFAELRPKQQKCDESVPLACTASTVVPLDDDVMLGTSLLGDHRAEFDQALAEGDFDTVLELVNEDLDDGADLICIPTDCGSDNARQSLQGILLELQGFITVPLAFVSKDAGDLEAALRVFHGKACVMAENGTDLDALAGPVLKYGAIIMGLQPPTE